jgi:aryl-alcohol dehydrogenase-like predicted oxidoreductase
MALALALRWLLDQPGYSVVLWGGRRPNQMDPVNGIDGWRLDREALDSIEQIVRGNVTDPVGPEFMSPLSR